MPTKELDATALRQWARECADRADAPRVTADDRDRLLKMKDALLALAATQDWLDGQAASGQAARTPSALPPGIFL